MKQLCLGSIVVASLAIGCGGGGGGGGADAGVDATVPDAAPPTPAVQVSFPPPVSYTAAAELLVTGTGTRVAAVTVAGVAATSDDGFATWRATVPLAMGGNPLAIDFVDDEAAAHAGAVTLAVHRTVWFERVQSMGHDATGDRVFAVDSGLNAIVEVNLTTGNTDILSGAGVPDEVNPFVVARALTFDAERGSLWVVDRDANAVLEVDVATGARRVASSDTVPDGNDRLVGPFGVELDRGNNRLIVMCSGGVVVAVDRDSGARSVISDASSAGVALTAPSSIALDRGRNRALLTDIALDAVIAVDLITGTRSVLSDASTPNAVQALVDPRTLVVDEAGNRALVVDRGIPAVVAVELESGARSIWLDRGPVGSAARILDPRGLVVDTADGRVLMVEFSTDTLLAAELATGARAVLASNGRPSVMTPLGFAGSSLTTADGTTMYVSDFTARTLVRVDLATGAHTVLTGEDDQEPAFLAIGTLAHDAVEQRLIVLDDQGFIAIDESTGARTRLADFDDLGNGVDFAFDAATRLAYVTTSAQSVLAVDVDTATITVVSSPDVGSGAALASPRTVDLHPDGTALLVSDFDTDTIVYIDLATQARTVLSDPAGQPEGVLVTAVTDAAVNAAGQRLILVQDERTLVAVDLATGLRTVLTDPEQLGADKPDAFVTLEWNEAAGTATCTTGATGVMDIDPTTGRAVVVAR